MDFVLIIYPHSFTHKSQARYQQKLLSRWPIGSKFRIHLLFQILTFEIISSIRYSNVMLVWIMEGTYLRKEEKTGLDDPLLKTLQVMFDSVLRLCNVLTLKIRPDLP